MNYYDPYYEYKAIDTLINLLGSLIIVVAVLVILAIIANWKIFRKAGQPGWAAIVPFYSSYIEFKIFWGNGWLFLLPLVLSILMSAPLVGWILSLFYLVISGMMCYKKSLAFGRGVGFAVGLFFLGTIFNLILAFGKAEYLGIPQDGFSYDQLKAKVDAHDDGIKYAAPPEESTPNVSFEQPDKSKNPSDQNETNHFDA